MRPARGGVGGTVPEHLVLVGGGAADISELAAPVEHGLFIPSLSLHGGWVIGRLGSALAEGVRVIRDGEPAEPVANLTVLFEPFELLSQVQALSRAPADGPVAAAALGADGVGDRRPPPPAPAAAVRRRSGLISRPSWPGRAARRPVGLRGLHLRRLLHLRLRAADLHVLRLRSLGLDGLRGLRASDHEPGRAARPSASGPVPLRPRGLRVRALPRSPLRFGALCSPGRRLGRVPARFGSSVPRRVFGATCRSTPTIVGERRAGTTRAGRGSRCAGRSPSSSRAMSTAAAPLRPRTAYDRGGHNRADPPPAAAVTPAAPSTVALRPSVGATGRISASARCAARAPGRGTRGSPAVAQVAAQRVPAQGRRRAGSRAARGSRRTEVSRAVRLAIRELRAWNTSAFTFSFGHSSTSPISSCDMSPSSASTSAAR